MPFLLYKITIVYDNISSSLKTQIFAYKTRNLLKTYTSYSYGIFYLVFRKIHVVTKMYKTGQ